MGALFSFDDCNRLAFADALIPIWCNWKQATRSPPRGSDAVLIPIWCNCGVNVVIISIHHSRRIANTIHRRNRCSGNKGDGRLDTTPCLLSL